MPEGWVTATEAATIIGCSRLRVGWLCFSEDLIWGKLRNTTVVTQESAVSYAEWYVDASRRDRWKREAENVATAPARFFINLFKTALQVPWN